jgi:hypothetical protein
MFWITFARVIGERLSCSSMATHSPILPGRSAIISLQSCHMQSDLRRRHYVSGVLDRESVQHILESLCDAAEFAVGDHVRTLRGSATGIILRIQSDGRVVWRPKGSQSELIALAESLLREKGAEV